MPLRYDLQAFRGALQAGLMMTAVCVAAAILIPKASLAALAGVALGFVTYVLALRGQVQVHDLDLLVGALPPKLRTPGPIEMLWRKLRAWLVVETARISPTGGGGAE